MALMHTKSVPVANAEVNYEQGVATIRIIAPDAGDVDIAGDFTDWEPRKLDRVDAAFVAQVSLPPGIYHFSVRLNGGKWFAPIGVPIVADQLGGDVGVLVLN